jgi:pimeloyl-ACP methyl ester carboxylesterase
MGAFYRPAWTSRIVLSTLHRERVMMPLGQAKLELSDRCGHYPQWEQPDAFVDLGTS